MTKLRKGRSLRFADPRGKPYGYDRSHFLGIEGLAPREILYLLDRADLYAALNRGPVRQVDLLSGKTVINLFYENSTRTRTSFEIAAKRMGAEVVNMNVAHSSIKKGETLIDTASTLNAMHPDAIVLRHGEAGAAELLSQKVSAAIINAGDGRHEHPTQALLDAQTIRRNKGSFDGLRIAICGDILHSRVARSNIHLLLAMGAEVHLIGPPTLLPSNFLTSGIPVFRTMEEGLKNCDIVMVLRLQLERMQGSLVPSRREYFRYYGLNREKLKRAKPDALVMHPGPINRGVEIDTDLADDVERSVIQEQVEMGVAVRMACLEALLVPEQNVLKKLPGQP